MQKIPTMYSRDESLRGHPVKAGVKPECAWVEAGEGLPTRKLDGVNVKIEGGKLYKRQKPKVGDYDEAAYVEARRDDPSDRYIWEGFDALPLKLDGIYEAVGPKIQANPDEFPSHMLIRVVPPDMSVLTLASQPTRTFEGLRAWLGLNAVEGIVFHHPDGRLAKIKRRDYGLSWPHRA